MIEKALKEEREENTKIQNLDQSGDKAFKFITLKVRLTEKAHSFSKVDGNAILLRET